MKNIMTKEEKKMSRQTHYFIAVPLPKEIKERLYSWCESAALTFPFKTWVHPEDYHITLAFLGNANVSQIKRVETELPSVVKKHILFSLTLSEINRFGKPDSPRILWVGVEKEESLFRLQKDVFQTCESIGFSLDQKPFKPHITVARKWIGQQPFSIQTIKQIPLHKESFIVDRAVLYQTHMDRLPKYETLAEFPLYRKES
jgi:RNA 2',3'-cyclic 3'-phosphodiesterase